MAEKGCGFCGKPVKRYASQANRSKTGNVYCNRSCSNSKNNELFRQGENHPNYVHGKSYYRKKTFERLPHHCLDCGESDIIVLEVHHIDGNRKNNEDDNLCILCANCHVRRHRTKVVITKLVDISSN